MLSRFALRNDKLIAFVVLVLAILGVRAYLTTPQSIFPSMSFARVDVVADAGDLPPDQVRVAIARPLDQAFETLPGVTNVVATSSQGSAEVFVDFAPSTDPAVALQNVDRALSQVRSSVPAAARVVAQLVDPNREPVLCYALTSNELSQTVLRQIATTQIAPRLYGSPGLGRLLVTGGSTPEYDVTLDPAQLALQGVGASAVTNALAGAGDIRGVGIAQRHYQTYAVLVDASLHDRASLAAVRVPTGNGASASLASLGTISLGVAPISSQTSFDGSPAVIVNAYAAPGADGVALSRALGQRIASVENALPANVRLTAFWDQSSLVVASQAALRDAILIGALIAIVVIYAFLRSVRLTLVAAAVIPLALAIALLALQLGGQTLNLMSVGGLAVAVGLIIDDAIVVIEGIARVRRDHPELDAIATIERSMKPLTGAMVASTTATVVVFLPLALLGGVAGYFFRALAFTLSASLVVSLGLALLVAPALARVTMRDRVEAAHADGAAPLVGRYDAVLVWALSHRGAVAAASGLVMLATVVLLMRLPSDFLPKMDEGQFEIGYTLPVGISLAASNAAALEMERIVREDPAVASVAGLSGVDSNGITPTQPDQGALRIRLRPPNERDGYEAVSARLRDRLTHVVPAALFDYRQILEDLINDLSGSPAPIEVSVRGDDQATVVALATRIAGKLGRIDGVVDASNGVTYDAPSIRIAPQGAALAALGIAPSDVGDALASLGQGTVATTMPAHQALLQVRVRVVVGSRGDAASLDPSVPLSIGGTATTLGDVATLDTRRLSTDIVTQNGSLVDRVTANFEGTSLSAVTARIRAMLRDVELPPGASVSIGGQAESQARSFGEFANAIGLAVVLVFAVMLAAFRSIRIPLVILTAVPLALIGVALALSLTRTAFNVSSFMGLLLLVGIVVKNGILLIDVANRRRVAGATVSDALLAAGKTRLRPIVMTTLAAIGGLFPLALGFGQGAEMERPLAIAVIGGLSTATLFTLIVIPVIYAAFFGGSPVRAPRAIVSAMLVALLIASASVPLRAQTAAGVPLVFSGLSLGAATQGALATSPDVQAARARTLQSRYALAAARDGLAPSLVSTYAQIPQGNPPGPNVISREGSVELQWSLGDVIGFSPAVREAALALAASQADERAAEIAERVKVCGLYFDALKARAVAAAARDALALATGQRDAATVRFKSGDVARLDVIRADVAVQKAQAELDLALANDENATDAVRIESGAGADAFIATAPGAPLPGNPQLRDPQTAVSLARTSRPEIVSAMRTAEARSSARRRTGRGFSRDYDRRSGYLSGMDSGVPVNAPTINANLTLPLGGGGAGDRASFAAAKVLEARAKAVAVERQIELDVAASARTLGASERAAEAGTRERESARAELNATEIGYRNGASSNVNLSAARSAYTQAVVDELSAAYDLEKARATLDVEVGS